MRRAKRASSEERTPRRGADNMAVMEVRDTFFTHVWEGMLDNRRRLGLKKVIALLRSRFGDVEDARLHFRIACNSAGEILLVPETTIPLNEAWLHRNPGALKSVLTGVKQAEEGDLIDRGSFAQYATDDDDE